MRRMHGAVWVFVAGATVACGQSVSPTQAVARSWAETVSVKGDVGYRLELISEEGKDTQQRDRIRARAGVAAKPGDAVKTEIELATGGGNPVSAYQTLGGGSSRKEIRLNIASIEWKPIADVAVAGGKTRNPFTDPGSLVWDGDVTPEGVTLSGSRPVGPVELLANAGYLWVEERSSADDAQLFAGQVGGRYRLTPTVSLLVGASAYGFQNMDGFDVIDWEKKSNAYGNSTVRGSASGSTTNKAYATGFQLIDGFARLGFELGLSVDLYGQYLVNADADEDRTGYAAGVTVGRARDPRSFEVGYGFRRLERDAAPGFMTDSDFWGGGSDGQGHKVYARYQIAKNVQCGVNSYFSERLVSDSAKRHDYDRFQVDIGVRF